MTRAGAGLAAALLAVAAAGGQRPMPGPAAGGEAREGARSLGGAPPREVVVPLGTVVTRVCWRPGHAEGEAAYEVLQVAPAGLEVGRWRPEGPFEVARRIPLRPDEVALLRALLAAPIAAPRLNHYWSQPACSRPVTDPARERQCTVQAGPAAALAGRKDCSLPPVLDGLPSGLHLPPEHVAAVRGTLLAKTTWAGPGGSCAAERLQFVPVEGATGSDEAVRGLVLRWRRAAGASWTPAGAFPFTLVGTVLLVRDLVPGEGPGAALLGAAGAPGRGVVRLTWWVADGRRGRSLSLTRCGSPEGLPRHPAQGAPEGEGGFGSPPGLPAKVRRDTWWQSCTGGIAGLRNAISSLRLEEDLGRGLPPHEARAAGWRLLRVLTDLYAWGLTEVCEPAPPRPRRPVPDALHCQTGGLFSALGARYRPGWPIGPRCGALAGAALLATLRSPLRDPEYAARAVDALTGHLWGPRAAGCGSEGLRFVSSGRDGPSGRHGTLERTASGGKRVRDGRWWLVGGRVLVTETDPDLPPVVRVLKETPVDGKGRRWRLEPLYPPHRPPPALVPCDGGRGQEAGHGRKATSRAAGGAPGIS